MKLMTEREWAESNDSYGMLQSNWRLLKRHPRKCRLFAVACCSRIWHLLGDERSRLAVQIAAQYADGLVDEKELQTAGGGAEAAHSDAFRVKGKIGASAEWAAQFAAAPDAWFAATRASGFACVAAGEGLRVGPEHAAQSHLLRCIFDRLPFLAVSPSLHSLPNESVVQLARTIYDEGAFAQMTALGGALESAGCLQGNVLEHCRHPGPHARGCWVIDLLLGRN